MEDNNHTYDLIDRYFEGDLNANEMKDFQEQLARDKDFAAAFEIEKDIIQGIEALGNQGLKATLQTFHQEEIVAKKTASKKAKVVSMRLYRWLAIAASFAFLAVMAIWLLQAPMSSEDLFAAHYETPAFETLRGHQANDVEKIKTWYQGKDFEQAIVAMTAYLKENPTDENIQLSLGIAQLEVGQYDRAIQVFRGLTNSEQLEDQATWFLAMTYLKSGQHHLAKIELEKLVDGTVLATKQRKLDAEEILLDL